MVGVHRTDRLTRVLAKKKKKNRENSRYVRLSLHLFAFRLALHNDIGQYLFDHSLLVSSILYKN